MFFCIIVKETLKSKQNNGILCFGFGFGFGVGPIELIEFSGVKLNNGLKISLKTMVLVAKMRV